MDSASLLSRESTTLSLANPQKGHFMALASNSDWRSLTRFLFPRLSEEKENGKEFSVLSVPRNCNSYGGRRRPWPCLDYFLVRCGVVHRERKKTGPAPPAVRAPFFPHAFPVTEA